ncbi:FtsB family cell division protein [Persicobacter psychrovividus]|uniref:Septum formation initiator n=1 Tax=Persicobacter psychrovividus TaxID=387638 RepID=A0ABM7VGE7_9BACT|nr:hypothetical protein PEPS_23280 [Persicobacter psychrovividus]
MKKDFAKLPSFVKSPYLYIVASFFIWMLCFDSNDLINQYQLYHKEKELEQERAFYLREIQAVKQDREELTTNKELLEKFAREKYLMKKKNEDVYIIEHQ